VLDQYKRGWLALEDWQRVFCEDFAAGMNRVVMGGQAIDNYSSFDWKLNAKQQIGLALSRRFSSLAKSFERIFYFLQPRRDLRTQEEP